MYVISIYIFFLYYTLVNYISCNIKRGKNKTKQLLIPYCILQQPRMVSGALSTKTHTNKKKPKTNKQTKKQTNKQTLLR